MERCPRHTLDSFDTFVKYVPKITIGHRSGLAFSQNEGPTFQQVKVCQHVFYWEFLQLDIVIFQDVFLVLLPVCIIGKYHQFMQVVPS